MHAWGSRAVRALAIAWGTVFAGAAWAQIDPGPSEISEQDLMNAFQQNGLRSSTTLVDYINFQSDLGGSISNTIMQSNLIDSLNSDGSGLYDLTKSYVQQELN